MKKVVCGDVEAYQFEIFEPIRELVNHGFSTRKGGVSIGCYESMNLHFRNDTKENVRENFRILCDALHMEAANIVFSTQIHEDVVYTASKEDIGKGLFRESDIKSADGLVTDEKNIVLTTFYADCVPLYFVDPVRAVIALAHAGWRGCVRQIGIKTLQKMCDEYGTKPQDVLVGIGPSIGACCFQVDAPVVHEFEKNIPFAADYIVPDSVEGKYKIDMQAIHKRLLMEASVPEENIEMAHICTKCNPNEFFSHRAMGNERGSLAALLELR